MGKSTAVLVVGWLWLRHGQRTRRLTVVGAVIAIAGLAMVLDLAGSARIDSIGVMWALLAAVCLAIYFLLSAGADEEPLPPIVMAWAGMCVGAAALAALGRIGVLSMTATTNNVEFLDQQVSWVVPMPRLSLVAAVIAYVAGIGAARRLGPSSPRSSAWRRCSCSRGCCSISCRPPCSSWAAPSSSRESGWCASTNCTARRTGRAARIQGLRISAGRGEHRQH